MKNLYKILCFIFLTAFFLCSCNEKSIYEYAQNEYIYGITVDDSWYEDISISKIVEKIKTLPQKPTVRIVMSTEKKPKEYIELFKQIDKVADIMATPVDSSQMIEYKDIDSYRQRFVDSYKYLKDYVDIWEIGNEINGEDWLGDDEKFISDKMLSAYEFIHQTKSKTALTLYYTKPHSQKTEMKDWIELYLPQGIKDNLNYLFVSYYEDDNDGYIPNWKEIFTYLEKIFPNSKLGIGECSSTKANTSINEKQAKYDYYYNMPKYTKNYIGGYFWWYFVQDFVINEDIKI